MAKNEKVAKGVKKKAVKESLAKRVGRGYGRVVGGAMKAVNPFQGGMNLIAGALDDEGRQILGDTVSAVGRPVGEFVSGLGDPGVTDSGMIKGETAGPRGASVEKAPDVEPERFDSKADYREVQGMLPDNQASIDAQVSAVGAMPDTLRTTSTQFNPYRASIKSDLNKAAYHQIEKAKKDKEIYGETGAFIKQTLEEKTLRDAAYQGKIDVNLQQQSDMYKGYVESLNRLEESGLNPDQWWNNRSRADNVAIGLAMAFDTVGEMIGKKKAGVVANQIKSMVDRDIRAQEIAMQIKKDVVAGKRNALDALTQQLGSIDKAKKTLAAGLTAQVNMKIAHGAQRSKSETGIENANAIKYATLAKADQGLTGTVTDAPNMLKMKAEAGIGTGGESGGPNNIFNKEVGNLVTLRRDVGRMLNDLMGSATDVTAAKELLKKAWLGGEGANIKARLVAMARQLGRAGGIDVGNLTEKEGQLMVEAIAGTDWNKAYSAIKNLYHKIGDIEAGTKQRIKGEMASGRIRRDNLHFYEDVLTKDRRFFGASKFIGSR